MKISQTYHSMKLGITYEKGPKLDKLDEKILIELNKDARTPVSIIARRLRISRDSVKYRLQRLIKEKVINGFLPIINPPKIGYNILAWVFFSLWKITPEKEKQFSKYLESEDIITYVSSVMGNWDYVINVFAKDPGDLNALMKKIREKFPDLIKQHEVVIVMEETKWTQFPGKIKR